MVITLSHDEVRLLRNADIRVEITRNRLIAGATQPSATSQPIGRMHPRLPHAVKRLRSELRQVVASLPALVTIG